RTCDTQIRRHRRLTQKLHILTRTRKRNRSHLLWLERHLLSIPDEVEGIENHKEQKQPAHSAIPAVDRTSQSQPLENQIRHQARLIELIRNVNRVSASQEQLKVLTQQLPGKQNLPFSEPPDHMHTPSLYRICGAPARLAQNADHLVLLVTNSPGVGFQLSFHQREPRTDEPPQVMPFLRNKIGSHRSTQIKHQAGSLAHVECSHQRQPSIQTQAKRLRVPVAYTGKTFRRASDQDRYPQLPCQLQLQLSCFQIAADTHQTTGRQNQAPAGNRFQRSPKRLIHTR